MLIPATRVEKLEKNKHNKKYVLICFFIFYCVFFNPFMGLMFCLSGWLSISQSVHQSVGQSVYQSLYQSTGSGSCRFGLCPCGPCLSGVGGIGRKQNGTRYIYIYIYICIYTNKNKKTKQIITNHPLLL